MVRERLRARAPSRAARLAKRQIQIDDERDDPGEDVYDAVYAKLTERTRLQEEFLIDKREGSHSEQYIKRDDIAEEILRYERGEEYEQERADNMKEAAVCDEPRAVVAESADIIHVCKRLVIGALPAYLFSVDDFAERIQVVRDADQEIVEPANGLHMRTV